MANDPIVEEVRKVRQELFERCGYDLERYMEFLRESQAEHGDRLVTTVTKRSAGPAAPGSTEIRG